MKKFTKIMLIIAASLFGVGLILCCISIAMGASVFRMAKNGELQYGNWHIGPQGLYYSGAEEVDDLDDFFNRFDDDDVDDIDDEDLATDASNIEFSTEVPAEGTDQSFDADAIRNVNLDVDAAIITVKEPDDGTKIRVVLKSGKEKYYSCNLSGDTLNIKYDTKNHHYKNSPQIILYLPKGSSFDELNFDIGAADMSWKDFDSRCNKLTVDVGAGNFEAEQFQVYGEMDVSVGVGSVDIKDGVVYGDAALDCGVGNFSMEGSVEGNLKADCGMGNMELNLNGAEKEYNYTLSCGIGSIGVNGETYSNISGEKEVKNDGAEKNMELDCGMGIIEVNFK